MTDSPRCTAHGNIACSECSRIMLSGLNDDGECRGCSVYGADGMHWDTCPERLRGPVYANAQEALAAHGAYMLRHRIRLILLDYARPTSGSGLDTLTQTVERIAALSTPSERPSE